MLKKSSIMMSVAALLVVSGCGAKDQTVTSQGSEQTSTSKAESSQVSGTLSFYTSQPEERHDEVAGCI